MKKIPTGITQKKLRMAATEPAVEEWLSLPEAAQRLSLPESTSTTLIKAFKNDKLAEIGRKQGQLTDVALEICQLMRELAAVKMEQDLLIKKRHTLRYPCHAGDNGRTAAQGRPALSSRPQKSVYWRNGI